MTPDGRRVRVYHFASGYMGTRILVGQVGKSYVCVDDGDEAAFHANKPYSVTAWEKVEPIELLTAKTCPRRPVLRHPTWPEGRECYPDIQLNGLRTTTDFFPWNRLHDEGYEVT